MNIHDVLANALDLRRQQVAAVSALLDDGATIPFIARYRKEQTQSCDEVQIAAIRDGLEAHKVLEKRRTHIISSLSERSLLSDSLRQRIGAAQNLTSLEDIYAPHKVKRRTRATAARERGLEPLAELLVQQRARHRNDLQLARYVNVNVNATDAALVVADEDAALAGARDILAERISEDSAVRHALRTWFSANAQLTGTVIAKRKNDSDAERFRDWFDWSEALHKAPSHRILALLRGAEQKVLRVSAQVDSDSAHGRIATHWCSPTENFAQQQVHLAVADSWKRLLEPSLINEALAHAKIRADADAITIFQNNMRELLLAAPLGQKTVLAVDPGLRTGCKIAVLGPQGALLHHDVLHLATSRGSASDSDRLQQMIKKYSVQAIAIGNGTGSREAETTVRNVLSATSDTSAVELCIVDESGASIYSASAVARAEFPDHDITVRGAVSIGRRLQDPLAELVKIDPKAIGVGQYQHDVNQASLKDGLDDTVMSCVNKVGVELNSASAQLLAYVSGLGPKLAQSIVDYRTANGAFASRAQIKKVPRLGARAFEQCAGFLRIRDGKNPLDVSAVHPERYALVKQMADDLNSDVRTLLHDPAQRQGIDIRSYISAEVGELTLNDIINELAKPGRDPRAHYASFSFADVHRPEDLIEGSTLPGLVTNVTAFGAFVDIGVHQDGLVHISQLANAYVKDPNDCVKVRQHVTVRILSVDLKRKRIALSMKDPMP